METATQHSAAPEDSAPRTLTALDRLKVGQRAITALEPVFQGLDDTARRDVLRWLTEQYQPQPNGKGPGRPKKAKA